MFICDIKSPKMKKTSFFFLMLISTIACAQDNGTAPKGNNLGAVLLVIGLIVFLVIARKMVDKRNKKDGGGGKSKPGAVVKENIYEPKYWYQCKNCRVTIRKDTMPNSADCFQAPDHHWTEMLRVDTDAVFAASSDLISLRAGDALSFILPNLSITLSMASST